MGSAAGDVGGGKAGRVILHLEPRLSFIRRIALLGSEGQKEVKNVRDEAKRLTVSCRRLLWLEQGEKMTPSLRMSH